MISKKLDFASQFFGGPVFPPGGVIALYTGMSVLSLFEFLVWMLKIPGVVTSSAEVVSKPDNKA